MLKQLNINNLILIEKLDTPLEKGFNVITGETGAGKSAIMSSLKLIVGQRADSKVVRKGSSKATVEAHFELKKNSPVYSLLQDSGIDIENGEDLIIKREVNTSGKGKAYINHQMAQVTLLKKAGEQLIQIVGQHANQRLMNEEEHRNIIDVYGEIEPLLNKFQDSWKELSKTEKKLTDLIHGEVTRQREIERFIDEIAELEEADVQEGEDEELFSEYTLLTHAGELANMAESIRQSLNTSGNSLIPQLNRQKSTFEDLIGIDPTIQETSELFTTATLELEEVAHSLNLYISRLNNNPQRAEIVNERLSLIEKIKRKYGPTHSEIQQALHDRQTSLKELNNSTTEIEELKERVEELKTNTHALASQLTAMRKKAAEDFEQCVMRELRELNMPKVVFSVKLTEQPRTKFGDEKLEFFFAPNFGENIIPVKESASGGEMSRILLAIEKILSEKNHIPTIIFDEIDSGIGGETAVVIGSKLREIGNAHQVMCITHFPQVASQAEQHLQIKKEEKDGRTISVVRSLDKKSRKSEIDRMLGKSAKITSESKDSAHKNTTLEGAAV